jgi:hypothetical protein
MIEAVSTLSVQSSPARESAPEGGVYVPETNAALTAAQDFVASRIRMDNLQDVAILEYRSSEGDVIRQYPTEKQIEAYKRAQSVQEHSRASARAEVARETAHSSHSTSDVHVETAHTAALALSSPAPQQAAAPSETQSSDGNSQSSGHSVLV